MSGMPSRGQRGSTIGDTTWLGTRRPRWPALALTLGLGLATLGLAAGAEAAPPRAPAKRAAQSARARATAAKPAAGRAVAARPPASAPAAAAPAPATRAPAEAPVRAAGAGAEPADGAVVKTEEARAGERTYTFGAQEVEGRLKSPQILYFLRRVRAEFDPAPLGHRSFLLELYDTRRHRAFE
jgi:hypothetical protein